MRVGCRYAVIADAKEPSRRRRWRIHSMEDSVVGSAVLPFFIPREVLSLEGIMSKWGRVGLKG